MKSIIFLLLFATLTTACRKEAAPEAATSEPVPSALSSVFQPVNAEGDPVTIPDLMSSAKPGDEVVFSAKVMGAVEPFVKGRALVVVGDEATITSCELMEGDMDCETPWDACCAPREVLRAGTATVQVVDESGKLIAYGLEGVEGLKPLSRLIVKGKVAPVSGEQSLVINATAIEIL